MSSATRGLRPDTGERGLASAEPAHVAELLTGAWDGLIELAEDCPLDAATRLPEWTVRDVLVHLGHWDSEDDPVADLEAYARSQQVDSPDDVDARNAGVVASYHDASRTEVLAALAAGRQRALDFLAAPDAPEVGRRWVGSVVGPLPMTGLLVAQAYELAVHGTDLVHDSDRVVPRALLDAGVGALVDVTGALAARAGIDGTLAVVTPQGCWATGAHRGVAGEQAWTTVRLDGEVRPSALGWPAVAGEATDVLEAASGRALAVQLLATRRLRVHRPAGLLRLLPALQSAPGLPGGSAVQASLKALTQTGQLMGRVSADLTGGVAALLRRR